jgi:predicted Fe-Mo cluster-binding NifX family protein
MKVCITSTGAGLDSPVDPTFGRARYFLLVDTDTLGVEALENLPGAHGAGVQAAQQMVDRGVKAVLTGSVGPNAFQGLSAVGIDIHTGATGTAREAMSAYQAGRLPKTDAATRGGHRGGRE